MTFDRSGATYIAFKPREELGDHALDLLIGSMRALEEVEGEQKGWDLPPQLFLMHLIGRDGAEGGFYAQPVPHQLWFDHREPGRGLQMLSWRYPPPEPDDPVISYLDSPGGVAAFAFVHEAWALYNPGTARAKEIAAGRQRIATAADRVEVRCVTAADINGNGIFLTRQRGEAEPSLMKPYTRADLRNKDETTGPGRIMPALYRLVNAARTGRLVIDT